MDCNKLIIIGGVGRSGTTVTGSLIASAKNTEYFYTPRIPYYLMQVIDRYEREEWLRLFDISLFKDLLTSSIAGRNLNLNPHDNSSVFKYKTEQEVVKKHEKSLRQKEIVHLMKDANVAIKILDNIENFTIFHKYYPESKAVVLLREPLETISSLLNKRWYTDEALDAGSPPPSREMHEIDGFRYPFFLKTEDQKQLWKNSSEVDRVCFYWKSLHERFKDLRENEGVVFVSYQHLVDVPIRTKEKLFDFLGLVDGGMSNTILNSIKPMFSKQNPKLGDISDTTRDEMEEMYRDLLQSTINK